MIGRVTGSFTVTTNSISNSIVHLFATRLKMIFVLLGLAWMSTGCSTPPVPAISPDQQDTAWYAYQQCTSAYGNNAAVCNNVGYQGAQGSYYYTGTANTGSLGYAPTYNSSGAVINPNNAFNYGYSYLAGSKVEVTDRESFANSLNGASEEVVKSLAAQWMDLAKRARPE
jgi:hypothetical protein